MAIDNLGKEGGGCIDPILTMKIEFLLAFTLYAIIEKSEKIKVGFAFE